MIRRGLETVDELEETEAKEKEEKERLSIPIQNPLIFPELSFDTSDFAILPNTFAKFLADLLQDPVGDNPLLADQRYSS